MRLRLLVFLTIFVATISLSAAQVSESDSLALVALYNFTDGDNWTDNTNWLTSDVGQWYGITVDAGKVTEVQLSSNNLTGTIPADLGNLTDLTYLTLYSNNLTGTIPTTLGNLVNLVKLYLGANDLSGTIPNELASLTKLQFLWLNNCELTGNIPSWIGSLTDLISLYLNYNELDGNIPSEIGNLSNLWHLILSSNKLSGSIPPQLGNLTNLDKLDLGDNNLEGSIPVELGNISKLSWLLLWYNNLSGEIPDIFGVTYNGYIHSIYLSFNNFTGGLPAKISDLHNLYALEVNDNNFSGNIPDLTNCVDLEYVYLENNKFTLADMETAKFNTSLYTDFTYSPQDTIYEAPYIVNDNKLKATVIDPTYEYKWYENGAEISGEVDSVYSIVDIGNAEYYFKVRNPDYIDLWLSSEAYSFESTSTTLVSDLSYQNQFSIYPNPAESYVYVELKNATSNASVSIYNQNGQLVYTKNLKDSAEKLSLEDLANGMYIIQVTDSKLNYKQKLIVK